MVHILQEILNSFNSNLIPFKAVKEEYINLMLESTTVGDMPPLPIQLINNHAQIMPETKFEEAQLNFLYLENNAEDDMTAQTPPEQRQQSAPAAA